MASGLLRRAAYSLRNTFVDGWYFGDEESKSRLCHLKYTYNSNIVANLVGGNFYTGLLLLLGADDGFIGLVSILVTAANMLQLFSPLVLEHFPQRKKLLIITRLVVQTLNIAFIGAIPYFPAGQQAKLFMFAAAQLILNCMHALTCSGLSVWHIQFIPNNIRLNYFTLITMTNGAVVALVNLIAGFFLDKFKAAGMELQGITILRVIAYVMLLYDLTLLLRMKEKPYQRTVEKIKLYDILIKPFREKVYLRTVAIAVLWTFTSGIQSSFFSVYMLKNIEASYSFINLVNLLNAPILMLCTPLWSKFLRRSSSWLKTLNIAVCIYAVHYFLFSQVNQNNYLWLYTFAQIWAFTLGAGILLAMNNVPYINIPKANQTQFISFYSTVTSIGSLLGVALGRKVVTSLAGTTLLGMCDKQMLLFFAFFMMETAALVMFILRRNLKEE